MMWKFDLGDEVKDVVTGFKGIIRCKSRYLTGCDRYGLQSQILKEDGTPAGWVWFDENELELVKSKKIKIGNVIVNKDAEPQLSIVNGGPRPNPPTY
jgi:hypothetical protein